MTTFPLADESVGVDMLAQPVLAQDFVHLKTADARQRPAAVRDCDGDDNFVGAWSVGNSSLDGVEVTAHESRVLMPEGYIDRRPQAAYFL
jgi:hypothetical protein